MRRQPLIFIIIFFNLLCYGQLKHKKNKLISDLRSNDSLFFKIYHIGCEWSDMETHDSFRLVRRNDSFVLTYIPSSKQNQLFQITLDSNQIAFLKRLEITESNYDTSYDKYIVSLYNKKTYEFRRAALHADTLRAFFTKDRKPN